MMDAAIETRSLGKRFPRRWAVEDLHLRVEKGQLCALLGPNGAGKTTLLRMLLGLLPPTRGHARVLGHSCRRLPRLLFRRIGFVSEAQDLPRWMRVDGYLDYCRALYPDWDRELERSLRKRFELPGRSRIRQLSRGMQARLRLLSSLPFRPELIVVDELFSGLDPLTRDDLVSGLLELAGAEGSTVLLTSHELNDVERLVDHVAFLHDGRLLLHEELQGLQERFRVVEVSLGDAECPLGALPDSWVDVQRAGTSLRAVETRFDDEDRPALLEGEKVRHVRMDLREIFKTIVKHGRLAA